MREWWRLSRLVVVLVMVVAMVVVVVPFVQANGNGYRRRQSYPQFNGRRAVMSRGNFCPYTVSKMVSCKVVNGTETYTGRVSVGQGERFMTMTRPRYSIAFKEVQETEYGCCPGFQGDNCDNRCFNCTQIQHLESRVRTLEAKLLRTPTASLPPRQNPVIQMGLPDTSHVLNHPLNGRRGRGRGRNGGSRGRNNRNRGRGSDRRGSAGRRGRNEVTPEDTYDVNTSSPDQCACPPGPQGFPGVDGLPGRNGQDGNPGPQGPPGPVGPPGPPGLVTSTSGDGTRDGNTNYIPGPPGQPGTAGVPGVPGERGVAGSRGQVGLPGRPGEPGVPGPRGPTGPQGLPGLGLPGPKGDRGLDGLLGQKGSTGLPGTVGLPGPLGPKGDAGLNGIAGSQGLPGPKGEIGPLGPPGPTGRLGRRGEVGPVGPPGLPGHPGPPGPPGPPSPRVPVPGGLNTFGGDYSDAVYEGSGYGFNSDDDEYPLDIPGIPLPRGRPGPPGPKGDKGDPGHSGIPGVKGDRGFEGNRGSPEWARQESSIVELFQTVKTIRSKMNLLDARVRILEGEVSKIMDLAGEEALLPGHPDAPYNPNRSGGPGPVIASFDSYPGDATNPNLTEHTEDIYRQVDRLNGLVNSALPPLEGEESVPLQPRVTFPVGIGRGRERAQDGGSRVTLPTQPEEEELLLPDTDDIETTTQEVYYDYIEPRYDDYEGNYEDDYGDYVYYDYNNRRKRQYTGDVKATQDSEHTATSDGRLNQKLSKNGKKTDSSDRQVVSSSQLTSQSVTDEQEQQQGEAQQGSRRGRKHNARRIENVHPLKAFGLRYRRGLDYLLGKSSKEDVTWI